MSENDYIAEYVKEHYPNILGIEFTCWKLGKILGEAIRKVSEGLAGIDWCEAAKCLESQKGGEDERTL